VPDMHAILEVLAGAGMRKEKRSRRQALFEDRS